MSLLKKFTSTVLSVSLVAGMITVCPATVNAELLDSQLSNTFNGHTYALFTNEMNWNEAKSYCEGMGGHLVTISSAEENQHLLDTFLSQIDSGVSIGFTDATTEGNWTWVTSEPANAYTNWDEGEPNDEANEDFALMTTSGTWNDGHLDEENWPFICEWDTLIKSVEEITLYKKEKLKVKVDFAPTVTCTTTKKSVATAKQNTVTAVKKGNAVITATYNGESKLLLVTVKNPTLNKKKIKLNAKEKFTLKITGKVGKAKFKSTNSKVATVNSKGKITAKKKGKATINVKTNGITLKCKVTVK